MGVLWELGQVQIETCIESEVRKVTTEILVQKEGEMKEVNIKNEIGESLLFYQVKDLEIGISFRKQELHSFNKKYDLKKFSIK